MKKYKLDLHVHSILSYDAGISAQDLRKALSTGTLDYIAITDHNQIDFAEKMQAEFGEKIIIGEEIMTQEGEVIGLFLKQRIPEGLSLKQTISEIKKQNALVYIPHPFLKFKHGLCEKNISENIDTIDILEIYNGRSLKGWSAVNKTQRELIKKWAKTPALGSDAHSHLGLGNSFLTIDSVPTRSNLLELLARAEIKSRRPKLREILAPAFNKLKKKLK